MLVLAEPASFLSAEASSVRAGLASYWFAPSKGYWLPTDLLLACYWLKPQGRVLYWEATPSGVPRFSLPKVALFFY